MNLLRIFALNLILGAVGAAIVFAILHAR